MKKLYKVGIYCRLSVEDAVNSAKAKNYIPSDESVSIENQYEILSKFVMLNGWVEVKTYRDDGYSGGNFQRPGFQEMLEDARSGLINLILVKDLSRLGRDFVEVGRYTDVVFPSLGCRFVSVLDCLDSEGDNTDMLHFRSLMNDYHLKDLSSKIKSVLHAKMKSGQYLGSCAPYGYRKSEDDKHQLVIDEEAAAVVQRIFEMRRSGMAYGKITAALNQDGILSPRWYWAIHYGNGSCKCSKLWAYATVKNILNDAVYTGTLTQNRTGSRSYKDKTLIQKPESEWISHVDAHEAIISPETWDAVQEQNQLAKLRCADNAAPQPALFTGKLVCADCGHPLVVNRQTKRRKNGAVKKYVSYYCLQYANSGHSICSWHRISEITLQQLILNEIKAQAKAVTVNEAAVLEKLKKQVSSADTMRQENTRQEIASLRRRVQELEQMTAKLYEDKVSGTITEATFLMLIEKSEQERIQKSDRLDALLSEAGKVQQELSDLQKWTALIRKYLNLTELDRNTVDELIDRIEVSEATVVDGKRHQNIKIFYRFVGAV
ncbi:MAG: recombinase family protein [Acutalibacteraceae bacterium]